MQPGERLVDLGQHIATGGVQTVIPDMHLHHAAQHDGATGIVDDLLDPACHSTGAFSHPRRIDLQAKAPELPVLEKPPASVTLENLWFYKDRDALVHDALELGILQRRALPIHTPDSFRKVQAGRKANVFHTWIKTVRFKVEGGR